ncbi:MAG: bifunctional DNA-formamidopyrimidine glycosylase/DNA-(apurinic or apyrimidinic site) lyase [Acidobacteriota bacterium]
MPELPEVETIVRALVPRLEGQTVLEGRYFPSRIFRGCFPPELAGGRVAGVRRYGKFIIVELDRGVLAIHLGMTGKLLFDVPLNRHTRAVWRFRDISLSLEDIRQFGRVLWAESLPEPVAALGPDPLEIGRAALVRRATPYRTTVKGLLLNQNFLRGLGNIYVDELLFRARIHPAQRTENIPEAAWAKLWREMSALLKEAIRAGGSSISDYVNTAGERGSFQLQHQVYARTGQPCYRCGTAIERIALVQRGTHFCPRCQRS